MKILDIDIERMLELFILDALTGVLTWRVSRGRNGGAVRAGDVAGCLDAHGYISAGMDGKRYKAHRIIWAMHYGEQPPEFIDHINGVRTDNRPANLRAATVSENACNMRKRSDNTSGEPGVARDKRKGKWQVYVTLHGKKHFGGYFTDLADAIAKAKAMRLELHGKFASHLGAQS